MSCYYTTQGSYIRRLQNIEGFGDTPDQNSTSNLSQQSVDTYPLSAEQSCDVRILQNNYDFEKKLSELTNIYENTINNLTTEINNLTTEKNNLLDNLNNLTTEKNNLLNNLTTEINNLTTEINNLTTEKNNLLMRV